mmetsp:Transcript_108130/g.233008  ORF Transcript_108130/g.233008 Transcript_108130/m.233008 type:complete len:96 (+) Transcript_108130:575-862(+)
MKSLNSNMNFYKMNVDSQQEENPKTHKLSKRLELFKAVSSRLKNTMKGTPGKNTKTVSNSNWLKAGPDPLLKDQHFSEFVDRPEDLMHIQLPKPK